MDSISSGFQCYYIVLRTVCVFILLQPSISADPPGSRRMHKDLEQLRLPPSAFSASSVYKNQPESQAHKANLVVFASQEESSGAWCPANPIQNQRSEWLQVEFDSLKIMRVLFTEGRANNQNAYVPAFLLRYQRQPGHRWYDYRMRNGTKILYANHNSQTIAISLDPPIVARRFRLYPYNDLEPRFMCLRLAVYGSAFTDGVIEYLVPEGDIYRIDPRAHVALNDTSYDGSWMIPNAVTTTTDSADNQRAYLYGGIGLLMDKQYYEGSLPESDGNHVLGWFRRRHSTPSEHVTMLFRFDQVRNFSYVRIHTINSLNYVALFRRAAVQFSIGGQYYDRLSKPILQDIRRDTENRQARWISIPLDHKIGRFVRITLWFDYDWIVLSEVTFDSDVVSESVVLPIEKASDPILKPHDVELSSIDEQVPAIFKLETPVENSIQTNGERSADSIDQSVLTDVEKSPSGSTLSKTEELPFAPRAQGVTNPINPVTNPRSSNIPYIIAILCCCLGSIAFATLFVFMLYRMRRYRHRRLKKSQRNQQQSGDNSKNPHQLLLSRSHLHSNNFYPSTPNTTALLADSSLQSMLPSSLHYTAASSSTLKPDGTPFSIHCNSPGLFAANALTLPQPFTPSVNSPNYTPFPRGLDQESLLALQLMHCASPSGSKFSSIGGGVTLARRPPVDSYPFTTTGGLAVTKGSCANTVSKTLSFCPPPPPDQPLPPVPPPSTSPDPGQQQSFTENPSTHPLPGSGVANFAPNTSPFSSYPFSPDGGLVLSFDGSLPEYASASMFSGNGSVQPSPRPPSFNFSSNHRLLGSEINGNKPRGGGETYCVPHQNGIHSHGTMWSPSQTHLLHRPDLLNTGPPMSFSAVGGTNSDCQTGSIDSSGMYYLANTNDSTPFGVNNSSIRNTGSQPNSMFISNPVTNNLIPVHGMTMFPEQISDFSNGAIKFHPKHFDTQLLTDSSDFSRHVASMNLSTTGTNGTTDTTDGPEDSG